MVAVLFNSSNFEILQMLDTLCCNRAAIHDEIWQSLGLWSCLSGTKNLNKESDIEPETEPLKCNSNTILYDNCVHAILFFDLQTVQLLFEHSSLNIMIHASG